LINRKYKVTGLDINKRMLEKAEKNIPKKNLILGDMINFDL
jgi:ubiquinone/menaquinone biosynthesis C-methylase UbiE